MIGVVPITMTRGIHYITNQTTNLTLTIYNDPEEIYGVQSDNTANLIAAITFTNVEPPLNIFPTTEVEDTEDSIRAPLLLIVLILISGYVGIMFKNKDTGETEAGMHTFLIGIIALAIIDYAIFLIPALVSAIYYVARITKGQISE